MAFARQHGVQHQTFIARLRKRREEVPAFDRSGPAFAEVLVSHSASAEALRIVPPSPSALEIASRAALPLALKVLLSL